MTFDKEALDRAAKALNDATLPEGHFTLQECYEFLYDKQQEIEVFLADSEPVQDDPHAYEFEVEELNYLRSTLDFLYLLTYHCSQMKESHDEDPTPL